MTDPVSTADPTPSVEPRSSRRIIIGVAALVVLVLVAVLVLRGCGGSSSGGDAAVATTKASEHRTLTVILRVGRPSSGSSEYFTVTGTTCASGELTSGGSASVIGPDGAVLASATLPDGRVETRSDGASSCAFTVTFDVPVVATYSVRAPGFGSTHAETFESLEGAGWVIGLKTGWTG